MNDQPIHKRIKTILKTEEAALVAICESKNLRPDDLIPMHSATLWQWQEKPTPAQRQKQKNRAFEIEKVKDGEPIDEQFAKKEAQNHFKTFEGNLRAAHTETHYVFTKVRQ